jgi:hypothetical protein
LETEFEQNEDPEHNNRFSAIFRILCFSRKWADRLYERVRDQRTVEAWLAKPLASGLMTQDQVDRDVNIFFVKLHLLDPTTVLPAFQCLVKGKLRLQSVVVIL